MAKNLYVRVKPKSGSKEFFRCGILFSLLWVFLTDLDDATAERLQNEQMLETSETKPEGFDDQAEAPAEPAANETPDETKLPESDTLLANIADLTKEVAELEEALTARDEALTARDEVIAELKAALEAKIAEATALTEQVSALQSQLEAVPKLAADADAPAEAESTADKPAAKIKAK